MIYLGADHGGYQLKENLKNWLSQEGYELEDLGAFEVKPEDDYPQYAASVAQAVSRNEDNLGILFCRSGGGMVVAANKIPGIRAIEVFDVPSAKVAKEKNKANIISLAADWTELEEAQSIVKTFLEAEFSQAPRHQRRIKQIHQLEKE